MYLARRPVREEDRVLQLARLEARREALRAEMIAAMRPPPVPRRSDDDALAAVLVEALASQRAATARAMEAARERLHDLRAQARRSAPPSNPVGEVQTLAAMLAELARPRIEAARRARAKEAEKLAEIEAAHERRIAEMRDVEESLARASRPLPRRPDRDPVGPLLEQAPAIVRRLVGSRLAPAAAPLPLPDPPPRQEPPPMMADLIRR